MPSLLRIPWISWGWTPAKGNDKERSNYCTIALISHASKVILKILQARLQQCENRELPDVLPGFRKGRGTRDQIANISWIFKKVGEFQKNIYFCFINYTKDFDCVDHNKMWKILKEMGIPDHLTCVQQLELDMEQQTGSKSGKEYAKAIYCHPTCLTYPLQSLFLHKSAAESSPLLPGREKTSPRSAFLLLKSVFLPSFRLL